jgi:hypothetical protein
MQGALSKAARQRASCRRRACAIYWFDNAVTPELTRLSSEKPCVEMPLRCGGEKGLSDGGVESYISEAQANREQSSETLWRLWLVDEP